MRKIGSAAILVFLILLSLALALGIATGWFFLGGLFSFGDFRGVALSLATITLIYLYAISIYRIFLLLMPLHEGSIAEGSHQEFVYHVYVLFYLILFNSLIRGGLIPIPIMRLIYLALGARLGRNTYSSGIIYDPLFVKIGENSVVGESALLVPHVIEGSRLGHFSIHIGHHVTIGAHTVVLSGVTVADHAIIAANSLVPKGTRIGSGEVWGGIPARKLK